MTFKETLLALMDAHREPMRRELITAYDQIEVINAENEILLAYIRKNLDIVKYVKENAPAGTGAQEPCDQPNGKDTQ